MNAKYLLISALLLNISEAFAQRLTISDNRNSISVTTGNRIAYISDLDTFRLGIRPGKKNETARLGMIFKTSRVTKVDSVAIHCGDTEIPLSSIRYIYLNKKNLELKIPGIVVLLASAGLLFSTINVKKSAQEGIEAERIFLSLGGLVTGAFLTFHNYHRIIQRTSIGIQYELIF